MRITTSGASFDKWCATQGVVVDSPENSAIDGPVQGTGSRFDQAAVRYGDEYRCGVAHRRTRMLSCVQLASQTIISARSNRQAIRTIASATALCRGLLATPVHVRPQRTVSPTDNPVLIRWVSAPQIVWKEPLPVRIEDRGRVPGAESWTLEWAI